MLTREENIARADIEKDGVADSFSGTARLIDIESLQKGDILHFPDNFEGQVRKSARFNNAEYLIVDVENDKHEVIGTRRVFASSFSKSRPMYEEKDGKVIRIPGEPAKVTGQVVTDMQKIKTGLNDQMNLLKGKRVIVSDIKELPTRRFNQNAISMSQFPQFDWYNKK